ncbi:HD domain-containing phosphohydrolase [Anaeroselena agilis]|uniref:PAS domain S-box protein n=1 Tax=Anaeroselena agilis TaxID=3063788 RepID=A0ABU3P2M0_9FIRM|nr:PAS domain S-box protein [Selenomonadales bacterium 4137-cl]
MSAFLRFRQFALRLYGWLRPDLAVLLFGFFVLCAIWGGAYWQTEKDRQVTLDAIRHDGATLSVTFEENVNRILKLYDQYLKIIKANYEENQAVTPELRRLIISLARDPVVNQGAIINPAGEMVVSLLLPPSGLTFSREPHFLAQQKATLGGLYVGEPFIGRVSGKPSIALSRRISNPDGTFGGIAYLALSADYLSSFYRDMGLDEHYVIRVIGTDRTVRASSTPSEVGARVAGGPLFDALAKSPAGFFVADDSVFGQRLLVSYRLMRDYPLVVQVGVSQAVLAPLEQRRNLYIGVAWAASIFVVIFTAGIVGRARRLRLSEERFRTVVTNTPLIIYSLDEYGHFTLNEGRGLGRLGLRPGAYVGQSIFDIFKARPESLDSVRQALGGERVYFDQVIDGVYLSNRMVPMLDGAGRVKGVIGAAIDITEQKQAEERLRENEERLQESFDELYAAHEELLATEEELRLQYNIATEREEAIARRNAVLASLHEVAVGLVNRLDLYEVLTAIVAQASNLIGTPHAFLCLVDEHAGVIETKVGCGVFAGNIGNKVALTDGLLGKAYQSGEVCLVDDYSAWENRLPGEFHDNLQSVVEVPLKDGDKVIGIFGLSYLAGERKFTADEVALLGQFAELAAIALVNARLYTNLSATEHKLRDSHQDLTAAHEELLATEEELRLRYDEVLQANEQISRKNALLSIGQQTVLGVINKLDMDELLAAIIMQAAAITGVTDAFVSLPSDDGAILNIKAGLGIYSGEFPPVAVGKGLMGKVFVTGKTEVVNDYPRWPDRFTSPIGGKIHALAAAPLRDGQKIAGVLGLAHTEPGRSFDAEQIGLLEYFCEFASLALANAALHSSLQSELDERRQSETTLSEILDSTNDAIIVNDQNGGIAWTNRRTVEMFGYTEDELKQHGAVLISTPQNYPAAVEVMRRAVNEGPQTYLRETATKSGQRIVVEINARRATIDGQVCCLTVMRDITAKMQIEKDLAESEAEKQAVLDAIPDLMLIFDQNGTLLNYRKPEEIETLAEIEPETIGRNIDDLLPDDVADNFRRCISQAIATGKTQFYEYNINVRGALRYRDMRFSKVGDAVVLAMMRDMTAIKHSEAQIEFLSMHDPLTGVYNRTYFEDAMRKAAWLDKRGIAVLVCDVDGLKLINDTLGHRAGDDLLRVVAAGLRYTVVSGNDIVARIGGDEFAVIIYAPDKDKIERALEKMDRFVADYNNNNPQLPLSLSIGWAADYTSGTRAEELFKLADNEMYRRKLHQSQSMRSSIVQTMMRALEERDHITEGHADRLQHLAEKLGQQLDLPGGRLADIRLLAKFHDIGKVGIPDSILNKPGRLTEEEMTIMRRHCEIGYRIARASSELSPIAEWILKHQEWWNGKGYPLGIAGEDIPLECRILGIVDAYDAMTSNRPYRQALSHDEALAEIARCAGSQFDPHLAELFIKLFY